MPQTRQTTGRWERRGDTITLFGLNGIPEPARRARGFAFELDSELVTQPVLRSGSRGSAVIELQRRLTASGYSPGAADGVFGSLTDRAVRAFQTTRRLTPDGVVGPQTWAALGSGAAPSRPSPAPTPPPYGPAPGPGGAVTLENILAAMRRKGYVIHEQPYRLNIVGVRTLARPNTFDDTINVFFKDDRGFR